MVAELQEQHDVIHPWHQRDVSVQSRLVYLWNKALESSGVCTRKLDCGMCVIGLRVRCARESLSSVNRWGGGGDVLSCMRSCVAFCRLDLVAYRVRVARLVLEVCGVHIGRGVVGACCAGCLRLFVGCEWAGFCEGSLWAARPGRTA